MRRIKMMLAALAAVATLGVVGANAAQAGDGHFDTDVGACDVTFTAGAQYLDTSHPGWDFARDLTAFGVDPNGSCDFSDTDAELHMHWVTATGDAQAYGTLVVSGFGGLGLCTYAGTLNGTWDGTRFELDDPSSQPLSKIAGSAILCPAAVIHVRSDTAGTPSYYTWLQP
ncbi:MAG: hypothetical protein J0H98_05500 [Solirubrobacterales bacterium]|nr:hypothetical protein [Solirubrobacterales bacterium]